MNKIPLLLATILLNIISLQCIAETRLHISTGFTPPVSDFYKRVLTEADIRMADISINFEILPAERSLILADRAINDGECCRIPQVVLKQYKNLIAIDESFFSARFSAFGKNINRPIKSFADLKPFTVGTVEGWKIAVKKIKEVQPAKVHILTTPDQMFQMIEQDRLDYGVVGLLSGMQAVSKLGFHSIHPLKPPLIEKPLYLLLNKKHQNLIPQFNKTIFDMKKDGTIDRLYKELIQSL